MKGSGVTVLDQFCGAGGSSIGATKAGANVVVALNHWDKAIATHQANFQQTYHECTDISAVNPKRYPATTFLITSPECTAHSLAKGTKKQPYKYDLWGNLVLNPADERSRATMWDVVRFAEAHRHEIIITENVVDVHRWEPWDAWLHAMALLGYKWECVYINSMFVHPTPQSRDRIYIVFYRAGNPKPNLTLRPRSWCSRCERNVGALQTWKNPRKRWGRYGSRHGQYIYTCPRCHLEIIPDYYPALNAIDWSIPTPRIGDRKQPLEQSTLDRIQLGLERYNGQYLVFEKGDAVGRRPPYIVKLCQNSGVIELDAPLHAQVAAGSQHGLVIPAQLMGEPERALDALGVEGSSYAPMPLLVRNYSGGAALSKPVTEPTGTITTNDHHALLLPFMTSYYGTDTMRSSLQALGTQTSIEKHALVMPIPFIASSYNGPSRNAVRSVEGALPTIPANREVHSFVQPSYEARVEDCGFRMLQPSEIQRAMAFPQEYTILGNKKDQVRQLGNAVTPPVMEFIFRRCLASLEGPQPSSNRASDGSFVSHPEWEDWMLDADYDPWENDALGA